VCCREDFEQGRSRSGGGLRRGLKRRNSCRSSCSNSLDRISSAWRPVVNRDGLSAHGLVEVSLLESVRRGQNSEMMIGR
jgi:hypothetical protein